MKFNNKNIEIAASAIIGKNVEIGDNTIIYDNVEIKDGTIICNNCVIGEPLNCFYHDSKYVQPKTIIGANSLIRSHTIIYAGCEFGEGLNTGHRATIREFTKTGIHCSIGTNCDIQGECKLGDYNRLQSSVIIGQKSKLGDYVFIYPFVVLTNDPTPPSNNLYGVEIGDYSQIAASSVLLPGAVIGCHSLIGANSSVGGVFEDYSFINGSPAKRVCDIRKAPFFNVESGKRHYPWPKHFERGMPWAGMDYEMWKNNSNK